MTSLALAGSLPCRFLDIVVKLCIGWQSMRRGLRIRVAFAPTRLSETYLRTAYEVVSPTAQRTVMVRQLACVEASKMANATQERRRGLR
jgi:hypothetical protein